MVWGGISFDARTELVFIENGTLTAHRYLTEVLEDHVVPFMVILGDDATFMHDNARPHTRFAWPTRSPDLNPIEDIWDDMGGLLRDMCRPPEMLENFATYWCRNGTVFRRM